MNSTLSLSSIVTTTTINNNDGINGTLIDDWESYKGYTRFYNLTDDVFLYANPILIIIGKKFLINKRKLYLKKKQTRYSNSCIINDNIST